MLSKLAGEYFEPSKIQTNSEKGIKKVQNNPMEVFLAIHDILQNWVTRLNERSEKTGVIFGFGIKSYTF